MLVLVAVGLMNVAWMVALTAVVFVEKVWRFGEAVGYSVGPKTTDAGAGRREALVSAGQSAV